MDEMQRFLDALAALWPELPALVGDDWPQVQPILEGYLGQLERDPAQAALVRGYIRQALRAYPAAQARLNQLLAPEVELPAARRFHLPAVLDRLRYPLVTRYTDIDYRRRVWLGEARVSVAVRLTVEKPGLSPDTEQEVGVQAGAPVHVRLSASHFRILEGDQRTLDVLPDRDSLPVVFYLQPVRAGRGELVFDFRQHGNPLATVVAPVEVTAAEVTGGDGPRLSQLIRFEPGAAPPDLTLYVAHEPVDGRPCLVFTLYEQGDEHGRTWVSPPIRGDLRAYAEGFYGELSHWTDQAATGHFNLSPAEIAREVRQVGQNLWDELIPAELQTLYAERRGDWRDKTLLLISDEPYLPWELVWPWSRTGDVSDDAPWGVTLRLARWLRRDARNGFDGPPATLRLPSWACIAPTDTGLAYVASERERLAALMAGRGVPDASPPEPDRSQVLALLETGGYGWLHAATHGRFDPAQPDRESWIELQGRQPLAPRVVVGDVAARIYRQRPGFFFNTCHAARQAWALTRLGGWATKLVGAGASAFLSPLWTVNDARAVEFAETFYTALLDGEPVAAAVHAARVSARRDGDPTWLAYSVFAHPRAKIG